MWNPPSVYLLVQPPLKKGRVWDLALGCCEFSSRPIGRHVGTNRDLFE